MSRQYGQDVFGQHGAQQQQQQPNPALNANAPVPKWKIEEQARKEKEAKAREEFSREVREKREKEEAEALARAQEADRLLATGHVKATGKNHVRSKKGNDAEAAAIESELNNLDALDAMFNAVLK